MKLEEFQAKQILERFAIPVPKNGGTATDAKSLAVALKRAGPGPWVIKAQVQTGGRGKAGGIKVAKNAAEAKKIAAEIIGMKLVTHQTGPEGLMVKRVLIEKTAKIKRELYMSITVDRKKSRPVLIASAEGGMEIEKLAQTAPEKIIVMELDPVAGLEGFQARELIFRLGIAPSDPKKMGDRLKFFKNCVQAFLKSDASLLEINPIAVTDKDELIALDAKIIIDDNALFRHPDFEAYEKQLDSTAAEKAAKKAGISYIPLTGNIGCMVNGAGLAMATMDIIKQCGGDPANFLDVGGGAKVEQVAAAFKIILSDKNVTAVLVNIFGGIMRCDVIAQGVIAAVKQVKLNVPLVVRLEGNKVEEGKRLLAASNLNIVSIGDFAKAAQKVVELAGH